MKIEKIATILFLSCCSLLISTSHAKIIQKSENQDEQAINAVIPSPNDDQEDLTEADIERRLPQEQSNHQAAASNVPIYVSPFVRSERASLSFDHQESSHAPLNYAPRPQSSIQQATGSLNPAKDLKTSASYGHHHGHGYHGHHGHHGGYDHSGWLDMGAWTGGKGSFGWYADYPVGSKHHHGYGRK